MAHNWESRNKPLHLWSINFQQGWRFNRERSVFSTKAAKTTGYPHAKEGGTYLTSYIKTNSKMEQRPKCMLAKSLQSCLTLLDPMECSQSDSSVHGILQARIMEWVAIPFSRGSSQPRDRTSISYVSCTGWQVLYHYHHLGSPVPDNFVIQY